MSQLVKLYEMGRTRESPMWAVLDWAAQQKGQFTLNQLYDIYKKNGGMNAFPSFSTNINRELVAKPWEEDQQKFGVSVKRPIVASVRGRRGKGGAGQYEWGLDGPLREPPTEPAIANDDDEEDAFGKALANLEKHFISKYHGDPNEGRKQLKIALARWQKINDPHRLALDIKAIVAPRFQMDAMQVATDHLYKNGTADETEIEDAEDELAQPQQNADPSKQTVVQTRAPQPKQSFAAKPQQQHQQPQQSDDDDDEAELAAMGFRKVPNDAENEPSDDEDRPLEIDDDDTYYDHEGGDSEEENPEEMGGDEDYPAFLPDPDEDGDQFEYSMFRLRDEAEMGPDDPIWEELKNSKNAIDAQNIIRKSNIPQNLHRAALLVAKSIFNNTGRDWDTGKKISGESYSPLMRIYEINGLSDPLDFDQKDSED